MYLLNLRTIEITISTNHLEVVKLYGQNVIIMARQKPNYLEYSIVNFQNVCFRKDQSTNF
jgi:hypothetical protein